MPGSLNKNTHTQNKNKKTHTLVLRQVKTKKPFSFFIKLINSDLHLTVIYISPYLSLHVFSKALSIYNNITNENTDHSVT